jgi:hypothetical protein
MRKSSAVASAAPRAVALAALLAAGALALGAQDAASPAASSGSSDDELFGSEETVTQAATSSKEAEGQSGFLKYDQVKVGGSFTGKAGFTSKWSDAWGGNAQFFDPTSYYITPDVEGKVTIVAKPTTDFGVNMDFRTSWPFSTTDTVATTTNGKTVTGSDAVTIPNISVWSLYSKFNWHDRVYFSFGKQPLAWGVAKGYFQPADDIFAVSAKIDPTDTSAEREGPISFKATVPLGITNNLYFYAGLPTSSDGSTTIDPADARLAVKGEYGFGDTELALAGYYAYNDHPRALLMGTTSLGSWNVFGEAVLKYGSERYYIEEVATSAAYPLGLSASQKDDQLWFTGTLGGYYTDSDSGVTVILQYLYNGEGQTAVTAKEAYTYYALNTSELDRIKFGTHNAFASISDTNLFPGLVGKDKLGASLIAIADLSDLSCYVMPSVTWTFFDYMILKVGMAFNFGDSSDEYIVVMGDTAPSAALTASLTIGTGSF